MCFSIKKQKLKNKENKMSTEITKKESTELVDTSMFAGAPSGFEGVDSSTFKTPFIKILQALSPELKKNDSKSIAGAEQGQFCNTASQEVSDELNVIVISIEHSLVVWRPERGGLVGRYPKSKESEIVARSEGVKKWDAEGNDIIDTIEFFCASVDSPGDIFILPMSTTALKYARGLATRIRMLKADGKPVNVSWAGVWNLKTSEDSNDKGSWFTVGNTPEFVRFITKEEKEALVMPAMEILKTAETDYNNAETATDDDADVPF